MSTDKVPTITMDEDLPMSISTCATCVNSNKQNCDQETALCLAQLETSTSAHGGSCPYTDTRNTVVPGQHRKPSCDCHKLPIHDRRDSQCKGVTNRRFTIYK